MITREQLTKKYGKPCDPSNHMLITLPYPVRLSWDKKIKVTKVTCHNLIAKNFFNVFAELLKTYGLDEIHRLGIDLYGGIYNCRAMRGGTSPSVHSWAVAIDLDPERNLLRENHKTARFARPEYKLMIDIFYMHGFESLGREKDFDYMHFQIAD